MDAAAADLAAAGVEVSLDLDHVPATVLGDERQLGRVVACLVDNAVASTPSGGTVRVTLRHEAGETLLEVADTGSGTAVCDQAPLVERFVVSIVAAHGGRVALSATPGVGTVVAVRLRRATDVRALLAS